MELSLKERLFSFLKRRQGEWIAAGTMEKLTIEKTRYTASNATRRLRELAEAGDIEVEHRGKNHSWYRYVPKDPLTPLKSHPSQPYSKTYYENVLLPEMLKLWNDQPQN